MDEIRQRLFDTLQAADHMILYRAFLKDNDLYVLSPEPVDQDHFNGTTFKCMCSLYSSLMKRLSCHRSSKMTDTYHELISLLGQLENQYNTSTGQFLGETLQVQCYPDILKKTKQKCFWIYFHLIYNRRGHALKLHRIPSRSFDPIKNSICQYFHKNVVQMTNALTEYHKYHG